MSAPPSSATTIRSTPPRPPRRHRLRSTMSARCRTRSPAAARTDDTTPTLTGTAENGATIKIYLDGGASPVATTTADAVRQLELHARDRALPRGPHLHRHSPPSRRQHLGHHHHLQGHGGQLAVLPGGDADPDPTGEVPIQYLRIGDTVVTRWGGIQPIKWIGRQSFAAHS